MGVAYACARAASTGKRAQRAGAGRRDAGDLKCGEDMHRVQGRINHRMVTDPSAHADIAAQERRHRGKRRAGVNRARRQRQRQPLRPRRPGRGCQMMRGKMRQRHPVPAGVGPGKGGASEQKTGPVAINQPGNRRPSQPQKIGVLRRRMAANGLRPSVSSRRTLVNQHAGHDRGRPELRRGNPSAVLRAPCRQLPGGLTKKSTSWTFLAC